MQKILSAFDRYPSQKEVVKVMLRHGISVKEGTAFCGDIAIGDSALGRAANVDRRVARATLDRIMESPELLDFFSKMKSISLLSEVAPNLGCTTLEIIPTDASIPGILADVTKTIFDAGISVMQAVVQDPGIENEAHLIIVLNGQLPPEYIPAIKSCRGVKSIIIR